MRIFLPFLALAPCLLPAQANAQSPQRDGLYAFAGIGSHGVTVPASSKLSQEYRNSQWKQSKVGYQMGVGYRLSDHLALELAGQAQGSGGKGKVSASTGDIHVRSSSRSLTLSGLGVLPLGDRFELFGRAGVGAMRTSLTATTVNVDHKATAGTFALQYGLGANLRLGERSFLRTEWSVLRPTGKSRSAAALGGERVYASQVNVVFGRHF